MRDAEQFYIGVVTGSIVVGGGEGKAGRWRVLKVEFEWIIRRDDGRKVFGVMCEGYGRIVGKGDAEGIVAATVGDGDRRFLSILAVDGRAGEVGKQPFPFLTLGLMELVPGKRLLVLPTEAAHTALGTKCKPEGGKGNEQGKNVHNGYVHIM